MKISVCCPSYKRAEKLETHLYLPFIRVYVDGKEYNDYKNRYEEINIVGCPESIQGNLCRVRNHILQKEFGLGNDVVCIVDDDMKGVYFWEKMNKIKVESKDFIGFIEKYSILAEDLGAKMWGININADKQVYREYSPFSTISYVGGPFQVFLKGNECFYDVNLPLKEDYDMSLQQLKKYRVLLRINKFFYDVKQGEQVGGCASYRNFDNEERQLNLLIKKWGSRIVRKDNSNRSHNLKRKKSKIDYNPIISVPIKGI